MSTAIERLAEIYRAFQTAKSNRTSDLKAAASDAQVNAVLANIDALNASYLDAVNDALDAEGDEVEQALEAAKAANDAIDEARKSAQKLPELIKRTTAAAGAVQNLLVDAQV